MKKNYLEKMLKHFEGMNKDLIPDWYESLQKMNRGLAYSGDGRGQPPGSPSPVGPKKRTAGGGKPWINGAGNDSESELSGPVSNCCGASILGENDGEGICFKCHEHCVTDTYPEDNFDDEDENRIEEDIN